MFKPTQCIFKKTGKIRNEMCQFSYIPLKLYRKILKKTGCLKCEVTQKL